MKYGVMPRAMWVIFAPSFIRKMPVLTRWDARKVMRWAKEEYRVILTKLPAFDKDDRFLVNILSAAMLASVLLHLPKKPTLKQVTRFYREAMTENPAMRLFCKASNNFTPRALTKLARQAKDSQARTNPYTWKFRYEASADANSYSAVFTTCGILRLFTDLGLRDYVPAMCALDYDMAAMCGTGFTRRYTLACGGTCCDCHYAKGKGKR